MHFIFRLAENNICPLPRVFYLYRQNQQFCISLTFLIIVLLFDFIMIMVNYDVC